MTDFISAVTRRSGQPADRVQAVLDGHGIKPWVAPSPARDLVVLRVAFEGAVPTEEGTRRPFKFDLKLGTGVWAITSVDNDVGKTSVLAVIRWLLSGRDRVDDAVRAMIERAELDFTIDGSPFNLSVKGARGAAVAELRSGADSLQSSGEEGLEALMDAFMLERLGLSGLLVWQRYAGSEDGQATRSGWQAFIPALFIPEAAYGVVLGEAPTQAAMLLQVFLAFPWYTAERAASLAKASRAQQSRDTERRTERDRQAEAASMAALQLQVVTAKTVLSSLPDPIAAAAQLGGALRAASAASDARLRVQQQLGALEQDETAARLVSSQAARRVRVLEESAVAGQIFSELEAVMCPRCEVPVGAERHEREKSEHLCAVCGNIHEPGDDTAALAEARQVSEAAAAALADASARVGEARSKLETADAEWDRADAAARNARPQAELLERRAVARTNLARVEGRLEELETRAQITERADDPVGQILQAAIDEAKDRMEHVELLTRVSEEILQVAQAFGLSDVTATTLDRAARVRIGKRGGVKTSFSHLSLGERLRLKVAVVIALLRIASDGFPGRHPGLLVIDSPAAEEMSDENLELMLAGLVGLGEDLPQLQILLATTRHHVVASALPEANIRHVPEGDYLW